MNILENYKGNIYSVKISKFTYQYYLINEMSTEVLKVLNGLKLKFIHMIWSNPSNIHINDFDIVNVLSSIECETLKLSQLLADDDLCLLFDHALIKIIKVWDENIKYVKWSSVRLNLKINDENNFWFKAHKLGPEDSSKIFLHVNHTSLMELSKYKVITDMNEILSASKEFTQDKIFFDKCEIVIPLKYLSKLKIFVSLEENMKYIEDNFDMFWTIFNTVRTEWLISSIAHLIKLETLFLHKLSLLQYSLIDYNNIPHFVNIDTKKKNRDKIRAKI